MILDIAMVNEKKHIVCVKLIKSKLQCIREASS